MEATTNTAADILRIALAQGENLAEYCEGTEAGDIIWERARKARDLGFYEMTAQGEAVATAKGKALLAA